MKKNRLFGQLILSGAFMLAGVFAFAWGDMEESSAPQPPAAQPQAPAAQAPTAQPQTQTAASQNNQSIGTGSDGQFNSQIITHYWENDSEMKLGYGTTYIGYYQIYIFYSDGTFYYINRDANYCDAVVWKGSYDVTGNKILLKNRMKTDKFDYNSYYPKPHSKYKEISGIIEASKKERFSQDSPGSLEISFLYTNDGKTTYPSYEIGHLLTITTNSKEHNYRIVKVQ